MSENATDDSAAATGAGLADDVSTLAWVQVELRRTLEAANKALRRYLKESEAAAGSDVDAPDPAVLRSARSLMHQGVGALELVGQREVALLLRASEAAVQRIAARPALLNAAAVETLEQASFALLDFLARQLAGKAVSPLLLFPQYRAAQLLAGAERVHPADLWPVAWEWRALPADPRATPHAADDAARGEMESLALALMRQPDPALLARMSDLCADLGAGAARSGAGDASQLATFWQLAAAVFEAQAGGLLAGDVYAKRVASRLMAQLRAAVRGDSALSDRLAHDLLFFCSHASAPEDAAQAPRLAAVRAAWGLADGGSRDATVDYETARLGRFDPAWVALAKKRVAGAKDAWSAVAGGELHRLPALGEPFALVGDSLHKLFPQGDRLAQTLAEAAAQTVSSGGEPPPALAMEVATSLLYLDACLEDGDLDHPELPGRVQRLAERIDAVRRGAEPQPLAVWMEELYRRVSDRQTMGSVVQELRASLSEVEKQIDQYFRNPADRRVLVPVPGQLQSMRGVLSVLGMSQASQAVMHMSDDVDALAQTEVDPQRAVQAGTFDRLADNLGALSFLIDMLSVQPQLAKSLFRFDPETGSLSAVMGQPERASAFAEFDGAPEPLVEAPVPPLPPVPPAPAAAAPPAPVVEPPAPAESAQPTGLEDDLEMREVFIEEAREVVTDARAALERLATSPDNAGDMTTLRRAFHTLKGSGRMVGLNEFGAAAWACEQLYNVRLATQPVRMEPALRAFTEPALDYLASWTEAIAAGRDEGHRAAAVATAADALRLDGEVVPISAPMPLSAVEPWPMPAEAEVPALVEAAEPAQPVELDIEFVDLAPESAVAPEREPQPQPQPITQPAAEEAVLDDLMAALQALPEPVEPAPPMPVELPAAAAEPETSAVELDFDLLFDLPDDETPTEVLPPSSLADRVPDLPSAADLDLGLSLPSFEPTLEPVADPAPAPLAEPEIEEALWSEAIATPAAAPPETAAEVLDFELDLGGLGIEPAPALVDPPLPLPISTEPLVLDDLPLEPAPAEALPSAEAQPLEIEPAALEALFAAAPEAPPVTEPEPVLEFVPEPPEPPESLEEGPDEEPVKVIGPLRIGIPLFNIFLNEADELSRRLGTELAEWALEHESHAVSDSSVALAHSLAGNSATVGYTELSALGRALEHALMRSQAGGAGRDGEPELFIDAAEEIRRLLHQFAAGFLRPVAPELMERLAEHERWPPRPPVESRTAALDAELAEAPETFEISETAEIVQIAEPAAAPAAPLFATAFSALETVPTLATAATARPDAFDDDLDLDAVDAIDTELFPIFEEEAEELLPQLQTRLRDWLDQPADRSAPAACMRTLHTFKGGSRLAGAMRLGEMAHRLETAIEHLLAHDTLDTAAIEPLLARADAMSTAFAALRSRPAAAAEALDEAPAGRVPDVATEPTLPAALEPLAALPSVGMPAIEPMRPADAGATAAGEIDWGRFSMAEVAPAAAPDRAGAGAAVRVRAGLLDRLVNQAGEVSITRARIDADVRSLQGSLAELTDSLDRMRRQLRDIELQAETQIATRLEAAKAASQSFDPLEMDRFTRFQELTRFMAESVNDVATLQRSLQRTLQSTEDELAAQARLTRELQDDLLRTRMVEFESLADRLYRTVRQAAKETGKPVRLDIVGGAIEIDRGVLERMVGPFEHLLRNAVVHGIESAERRAAAGKTTDGQVTVQVAQAGNEVAVEVYDDGGGLDLPRIHARAIERGLLPPEAAAGDAELAQLIFAPGFSTAESVTELAGRGVGMDVVRAEVNAMGGRIETASTPGQGTRFRLLLPLTTAVTQVVMLRAGALTVAVPATLIEVVRRVPKAETDAAYASGQFAFADETVPFFWLPALLQAGTRGDVAGRAQTVVVVRSAAQRVALHVDEVLGNQEVVVKNVGPQLARLPGLAGVTLLPSGAVSLIYNPVALAALYAEPARVLMRQVQPAAGTVPLAAAPRAPLVMVVDDSLTVRRVTQRLLLREGYRVVLAKDGLEALERLAEERPMVLLSDIEMPRMDGFDLLRNVRADERLAGLPVVMISSRIAQKHRDYAAELGVDHYLGKPFSEDQLLALVAGYAGADRPVAAAAQPH